MDHEPGDEYIRRISAYIRTHEDGLAAAGLRRRRAKDAPETSVFNPLGWFSSDPVAARANVKPVVLSFDPHHIFYLLMRMEAVGLDIGSLDVQVEAPSRPMNYISIPSRADKSDALSFISMRSSLSAVSRLSLGAGWWGRPLPPSVDVELKYIYSCFTKLPALAIHAPEARLIAELANEAPNENALPLDAFKNLQTLQCVDIDPRTLLGWDRLAESLRSLTIIKSGLEDVSDIFLSAVLDDQARREGKISSTNPRTLSHVMSRQASFRSTPLPDSVLEVAEDGDETPVTPTQDSPKSSAPGELSSLKWAFLRHLSLSDNALTFLSSSPLPYFTSVTHLDLSSNLLVSVPPGLHSLYNLVSLNLSDNMIDSVLGIYKALGQVLYLNLSRNRLESICGLERLLALERVDLRQNLVEESAEIGRLATLPNVAEVWIEGNPLAEIEEGYRIRCFDLFAKEGKTVQLDGTPPSMYERMYMTAPPPEQMTSTRPVSVAQSPPVVAVGSPAVNGVSPSSGSPLQSPSPGTPPSNTSPHMGAVGARGRRRRNKRIVDLNGGTETSEACSSRSPSHTPAVPPVNIMSQASPAQRPADDPARHEPALETPPISEPPLITPVARAQRKSRHTRMWTEFAPTSFNDTSDEVAPPSNGTLGKSASMRTKGDKRRARVSASVYEQPGEEGKADQFREAEMFRARMEALRSDMGDGWLKVFNQSQLTPPAPSSTSR